MIACWINPQKRRYYRVYLQRDLFGDETLVRSWGSLDTGRGQMRIDKLEQTADIDRCIQVIHRRRMAHGYLPDS